MKIALVGVTGYTGATLFKLLKQHPKVDEVRLYGRSTPNDDELAALLPGFRHLSLHIHEYSSVNIMQECDLVFFATPAKVTSQLALDFIQADFPVIDLSGDLRLKNSADYERYYQAPAAPNQALQAACYNLADLRQPQSNYIANPGCYATATLLATIPLLAADLIDLDSLIVDAKSGLSGAGKKLTTSSHYAYINENSLPYKVNQHQHIPEIIQELQTWQPAFKTLQFTTTLIPVTRGIMASVYAKPKKPLSQAELYQTFADFYQDKPFVRVLKDGFPSLKEVAYSNYTDIGLAYDEASHTIFICSVIDNLMKGASSQAIQNMNLLCGFPLETGLTALPTFF
ncbi:N-acetyl-gamma-glutamyl-phosphate reductase [Ligilactobacillus equi]|uniref:N-acetyl-gamma-glutamyl-phosphate reductase n=1 Tax=Ligilactobacillus equi DSM 15833 = JCM 10991 TaxID=1423740 RepID=A0A0R1TP63_9LACO|nr:N-acetyl-gamma-glutamyl-phosphate reductase [Ligilactobacillus equi]KRL83244.1 N-acetyl-gamma-glutamyl-phosphate reductase [Ligilactobacillus equi DSM 15833 = JCM 10991]